eukprot:CAMPEP_0182430268 /NCGR_PEP_ID=MMETSP1167-20130531/38980_1 /TAXON_ID=2988 /ORGANISM="Mallomonas Sp, Strain CCMP3275" /LENGTH=71 /DNA_ID=CAMNT_0024615179 /DNA_START=142 /DNA_END=357 /DNA_ORIENTATION=+
MNQLSIPHHLRSPPPTVTAQPRKRTNKVLKRPSSRVKRKKVTPDAEKSGSKTALDVTLQRDPPVCPRQGVG